MRASLDSMDILSESLLEESPASADAQAFLLFFHLNAVDFGVRFFGLGLFKYSLYRFRRFSPWPADILDSLYSDMIKYDS